MLNVDKKQDTPIVPEVVFQNAHSFELICKSEIIVNIDGKRVEHGFEITEALEIKQFGCLIRTKIIFSNISQCLQFIPDIKILRIKDEAGNIISRELVDKRDTRR